MKPMKLSTICEAVGGKLNAGAYAGVSINGAATDSRGDLSGKLFVAIKGENVDGHDYIESAFNNGAAAVFCEQDRQFGDRPVIYVDSTLKALKLLGKYYRSLFNVHVIGVTGSVGKTTVKDMIACVLSEKYNTMKTKGNLNTDIGMPISLLELNDKHECAVIEMGMRNFGEIKELAGIAKPETAVITNIGFSHIEILGSREGIMRAKCELIDSLDKNGRIVLNADDDMLFSLKEKYKGSLYFGTKSDNYFSCEDIEYNGIRGVTFTLIKASGAKERIFVPVPGRHMVINAMCAATVGDIYGLTLSEIKSGIEKFKPSDSRMEIHDTKDGVAVIDDAYNASPSSMQAAFEVLAFAKGRKFCVLGDMRELGVEAERLHAELGEDLAEKDFDYVFTFGDKIRLTAEKCAELSNGKTAVTHFDSKSALISELKGLLIQGDTVLVKASRALKFEEIITSIIK